MTARDQKRAFIGIIIKGFNFISSLTDLINT